MKTIITISVIAALATLANIAFAVRPVAMLQIPCELVNVVDGDTVDVRITLTARVRLLECWAQERGTNDGDASTANLRNHVATHGRKGLLTIPLDRGPESRESRLDDYFTFGRILGHVELDGAGESVSAYQVRTGHATREK